MNKKNLAPLIGALLVLAVAFVGLAAAQAPSQDDVHVDYIISPDMLRLNAKAPSFAVEINNSTTGLYNIHDIDASSVRIWIGLPNGCEDENGCNFAELDSLALVKPNPEINVEQDKLVLMYYRSELYEQEFTYKDTNGNDKTENVFDYLESACGEAETGQVKFRITGKFKNGGAFKGPGFIVDVGLGGGSGKGGSGEGGCGGSGGEGSCGGSGKGGCSASEGEGSCGGSGKGGSGEGSCGGSGKGGSGEGGCGGSGGEGGCDGEHDDGGCDGDHDDELPPEAIPEFPTIAIPLVATIGLMFAVQRRK